MQQLHFQDSKKKKKQNRGHLYGFKNYAIIGKIIQQSLE